MKKHKSTIVDCVALYAGVAVFQFVVSSIAVSFVQICFQLHTLNTLCEHQISELRKHYFKTVLSQNTAVLDGSDMGVPIDKLST